MYATICGAWICLSCLVVELKRVSPQSALKQSRRARLPTMWGNEEFRSASLHTQNFPWIKLFSLRFVLGTFPSNVQKSQDLGPQGCFWGTLTFAQSTILWVVSVNVPNSFTVQHVHELSRTHSYLAWMIFSYSPFLAPCLELCEAQRTFENLRHPLTLPSGTFFLSFPPVLRTCHVPWESKVYLRSEELVVGKKTVVPSVSCVLHLNWFESVAVAV